jgi:xanthine dehydrogenase iron-sulfur cluster and FAD-binding subunit A
MESLQDAVRAVGKRASDVEDHLKGRRATTNSERVHDALEGDDETPLS